MAPMPQSKIASSLTSHRKPTVASKTQAGSGDQKRWSVPVQFSEHDDEISDCESGSDNSAHGFTSSHLSRPTLEFAVSQHSNTGTRTRPTERPPLQQLPGIGEGLSLSIDSDTSSEGVCEAIQSSARRKSRDEVCRAQARFERRKSATITHYNSGRLSFTKVSRGCRI